MGLSKERKEDRNMKNYDNGWQTYLDELRNAQEKEIKVADDVVISCETSNIVNKQLHGWKITGKKYEVRLLVMYNGNSRIFPYGIATEIIENDKDEANRAYLRMKELTKNEEAMNNARKEAEEMFRGL